MTLGIRKPIFENLRSRLWTLRRSPPSISDRGAGRAGEGQAPPRKPQLPADVQELRKELEEARKSADRVEKERESLREQLAAARADIAGRRRRWEKCATSCPRRAPS